MKKNNKTDIKIINNGENISDSVKILNKEKSRKKIIFIYIIPLIALVILGFVYIFTQINILLIPFSILMFIVLLGWDGATRTCPNCKVWNSVIWIKSENVPETEELKEDIDNKSNATTKVKRKKKNKSKKTKIKHTINQGKCKKCGCIFERKSRDYFKK